MLKESKLKREDLYLLLFSFLNKETLLSWRRSTIKELNDWASIMSPILILMTKGSYEQEKVIAPPVARYIYNLFKS